ncbi:MAG: indolepyruvate ferredoxin oxidoreductase [Bacteroidetes bacterium GWA2_32_17]|nr:MAG: indolepyruvate ferredoxin oxidoreductase [Bacteroidetes bacterium GWA2_32_17]
MQKLLLLGDEAIALGAIDSGLSGVYAYPGTPSTEITEYIVNSAIAKQKGVKAKWCTNEKTAMEAALGMSYAGKRAMVCMKHVGLNVAADGFINSAITGVNGGLIVVVADDPSMHSSQNEQDSRFYGKFALIPIFEPFSQQEAYNMVHYGFEISEKYNVPVMLRITTRMAHSRAGVVRKFEKEQNLLKLPSNLKQFILLPVIAKKNYRKLLDNQVKFENEAEISNFNKYFNVKDKSKGLIACGIAYNYIMENYQNNNLPYPLLVIGQHPVPRKMIQKIYSECSEIYVFEDGYPLIEELLKGILNIGKPIHGRLDGTLPRNGELTPNNVAVALGLEDTYGQAVPAVVAPRPPSLCKGCPHNDTFLALNEALKDYSKGRVFSDIGCYTLGALPPLESINSCVDMGASITMAYGASDAGLTPAIAVIGDSTFTHSGMTGLLDCATHKANVKVFILDNFTTGMTGGQPSAALNKIDAICLGVGIEPEHLRVLKPLPKNHDENVKIIKEELAYNGPSVIITRRECIITLDKRMREKFIKHN